MRTFSLYRRWLLCGLCAALPLLGALTLLRSRAVDAGLPALPPRRPVSPTAPMELEPVGSFGLPGETAQAVTLQGNYAYVSFGPWLVVLDVTQPTAPVQLGQTLLPMTATRLASQGVYVYALAGGLQVIDVANPAAPAVVGACALPGNPRDIAVAGNHVYIAAGSAGLRIVDVSNPANPHEVSAYTQNEARSVDVAETYAYIIDAKVLRVVDVSTPTAPHVSGVYTIPSTANVDYTSAIDQVVVVGNHAYVPGSMVQFYDDGKIGIYNFYGWLVVVDISTIQGTLTDVAVSGGYVYVCAAQLQIFQHLARAPILGQGVSRMAFNPGELLTYIRLLHATLRVYKSQIRFWLTVTLILF
ncbi:MAG: hypothetical protein JXR84_04585 [Anaerolineae bacterium]|nr:hypothetical protein [Anaerolineae bacterium]